MFSEYDIRVATIVLKKMWASIGDAPLVVQLAADTAAEEHAWRIEAKKYLREQARRRHYGLPPLTLHELREGQYVPPEWDELVGEKPGPEEPLPDGAKLLELPN